MVEGEERKKKKRRQELLVSTFYPSQKREKKSNRPEKNTLYPIKKVEHWEHEGCMDAW